jgi:tetratricopeptide (TPR) repeat protein
MASGLALAEQELQKARTPDERTNALRSGAGAMADALESADAGRIPEKPRNQLSNRAADVLNRAGDGERAKRLSDGVLERDPKNREALDNRAISQYQLGRYNEAVEDASSAIGLEPRSQRAFVTRALAYYQMRDYAHSLEDARMALSIDPNDQLAFQIVRLSETRVTKSSALGLDAAQKAAADKVAREYESLLAQRGRAETESEPAPETGSAAQNGSEVPAEHLVDALNQKALTQVRLGDPQAAIRYAGKALEQDPKNADALSIRAAAQNMAGLYLQALEDASASLRSNPSHSQALDARAAALLGLNRCDEALIDAQRAISLSASHAQGWRHRGLAKECLGDLQGMAKDLRKAADLGPQFESGYREALSRHGLSEQRGSGAQTPSPDGTAPKTGRRFLIVLFCSLSGGLLIAAGLLHLFGARAPKTQTGALEAGYKVLRVLGQGGMGVVYEAEDKALGRKVAIKRMREEIRSDPGERRRFLEEARTVASLHHPNIVDIHTIVESGEELYLIFEYVAGRTLDGLLEKQGRLPLEQALFIARGILSALSFAHQQNIVHRDLKPSNIMLADEGWVKVMDFGIARRAKDALARRTGASTVRGTPQYMAPEQERGEVRPESDFYALGCVLYEAVCGRRPFADSGSDGAKRSKDYARPSALVPGLPKAFDALIDELLEPDPARRLAGSSAIHARLDALAKPA